MNMTTIRKNAIVPYTDRQMFELVNDIEAYPRFLPWCHRSKVLDRQNKENVATLEIEWKGIRKEFTTCNRLYPYGRMEMGLVKGPLRKLNGIWLFESLSDKSACKVSLDLEFEMSGHFLDRLLHPIFHHMANTLVDAFCKRAMELYGSPE